MDIKQEVLKNLSDVMSFVGAAAKSGAAFVKEQAPLVIQEYLRWYLASSIFFSVVGLILCIIGCVSIKKAIDINKVSDRQPDGIQPDDGPFGGIGFLLIISGTLLFFKQIYDVIYVLVAPRLVIIDYLKDIIK